MRNLSVCIGLVVTVQLISACAVGPSMMRASRLAYNDAVQLTERQELLLNIVRLTFLLQCFGKNDLLRSVDPHEI